MAEPSFVAHSHDDDAAPAGRLPGPLAAIRHALDADHHAAAPGFLQSLDPRCKLLALLALIIGVVLAHTVAGLLALLLFACLLGACSGVTPLRLARQVWLGVLFFTGCIALPALFLVPGTALLTLPGLGWAISDTGLRSATLLVLRGEASASLAFLLVMTTPWPHVLKALRSIGMPVALVAMLGMTHRYLFILLDTAQALLEARRCRLLAPPDRRLRRQLLIASFASLFERSLAMSHAVHQAMLARGYRGEVRLLDDFRARPRDGVSLACALLAPVLILGLHA